MSKRLKNNMLKLLSALTMLSITTVGYAADKNHTGFDKSKPVATKSADINFVNINPMIRFGPAYGNFSETPHGTFGKFPANFETPMHVHSGAYHAVVISGTMTNPFEGDKNPPKLEPGSYWYVPAGMHHTTACISSTPCEFYFHADSSFDFTPVE